MATPRAPEEDDYKGSPILRIYTGKIYKGEEEYISFGVRKAAAICEYIDTIRAWVEKNGG